MIALYSVVSGSDSSDAKTGGVFFSGKPVIRRAMELADGVMFDSPEKRLKMPLCTDPSDAEDDDDDEEEEMEVTLCLFSVMLTSLRFNQNIKYVVLVTNMVAHSTTDSSL